MSFFNSAVGVLQTPGSALGAGPVFGGVINLFGGLRLDNPGAKSQGMKQLMAGGGVAPDRHRPRPFALRSVRLNHAINLTRPPVTGGRARERRCSPLIIDWLTDWIKKSF